MSLETDNQALLEIAKPYPALTAIISQLNLLAPSMVIDGKGIQNTPNLANLIDKLLQGFMDSGTPTETMAKGYLWLCNDHFVYQRHLMKHGVYKNKSFAEVNASHYQTDVMKDSYLFGLLISNILWANHSAICQMYMDNFLNTICEPAQILEVGCGHGLFSFLTLNKLTKSHLKSIDISPHSVNFTQQILNKHVPNKAAFQVELADVFQCDYPEAAFDVITLSEVVEHLEEPEKMVRHIKRFLKPGGKIWLTTCANAGHTDHIYLFESTAQMRDFVKNSGLVIQADKAWPLMDLPEETLLKRRVPINYAAICTLS